MTILIDYFAILFSLTCAFIILGVVGYLYIEGLVRFSKWVASKTWLDFENDRMLFAWACLCISFTISNAVFIVYLFKEVLQ